MRKNILSIEVDADELQTIYSTIKDRAFQIKQDIAEVDSHGYQADGLLGLMETRHEHFQGLMKKMFAIWTTTSPTGVVVIQHKEGCNVY